MSTPFQFGPEFRGIEQGRIWEILSFRIGECIQNSPINGYCCEIPANISGCVFQLQDAVKISKLKQARGHMMICCAMPL